jgi:predicted dehydrogenase
MFNFAMVGCGSMAHVHARELLKLGNVRIVALVDPSPPHAENFRKTHAPDAVIYESLQTLIDKPPVLPGPGKVDAIVIVTPHTLHYSQARLAMENGIHVLVEKPMVTSSADAYDLWRISKSANAQLGVAFQAPYTANFGYLAQSRDSGRLGRVQVLSGYISQNWQTLCSGTWRHDPALSGGGYLYDTGAHLLNAAIWLMNEPVIEVAAFIDNLASPVDIVGSVNMKFQSGAIASLAFAGNTPPFGNQLSLFSDVCSIHTDAYGSKLQILDKDAKPIPLEIPVNSTVNPTADPPAGPHANFVAALAGLQPLRAGPRFGVLLSALMDGIYESHRTARIVKLDPVPTKI